MTDTTDLPSQYPFDSPDRENMRAETRIAELLKAYNDATPDDLVQLIYGMPLTRSIMDYLNHSLLR